MPFDDEFDQIYQGLIGKALERAGYEVTRADTKLDQQNVMKDVVRGIAEADLVVADLTGNNANVMYEVGVAHGLGRPTTMISQALEDAPFDLRSYRILVYSTHFEAAAELSSKLEQIGRERLAGTLTFGSPVADFSDTTLAADALPASGGSGPEVQTGERGFIDHLVAHEEAVTIFSSVLGTMTAETAAVGDNMVAQTERIESLREGTQGAGAARQFQQISIRSARDLDKYAGRLEELLPELDASIEAMAESGIAYVTWLLDRLGDPEDKEDASHRREELDQLRTSTTELLETTQESLTSVLGYRETVNSLQGISSSLTTASKRTVRDLDRVISGEENVEAYAQRILALISDTDDGVADGA